MSTPTHQEYAISLYNQRLAPYVEQHARFITGKTKKGFVPPAQIKVERLTFLGRTLNLHLGLLCKEAGLTPSQLREIAEGIFGNGEFGAVSLQAGYETEVPK